ncbi:MAG: disulfide bond formation protein DsbA [Proteobacteria bacterium]|nr:MAG: disulfide bond formation protein DsbA [Pseudomonadota bacterium]
MNKKEHQRQVREQKQAAAERKAAMMKMTYWGLGALVVAFVLFYVIRSIMFPPPSVSEVVASDHSKGNPNAPVTIVEYSDFQCPACKAQYDSIKEIWSQVKSSVRLVYRHFPLTNIHPHSMTAAHYAEAAARQGKFWEMHDLLFENYNQWVGAKDVKPLFDGYVKQLGLDAEQFAKDVDSSEVRAKIASDLQSARRAHVAVTPSLYLNGELVTDVRTADKLKEAIRKVKDGY